LRNFAIFLLIGNMVWWSWQLYFHKGELTPSRAAPHAGFIQADKKLRMLSEASLESRVENPGQATTGAIATPQEPLPLAAPVKADAVVVPPVPVPITPAPWCGATNGLALPENAKSFQEDWLKLGGEAEQEQVKEPVSSTWWVYLPAFKDEEAAKPVLKQLQDKKIDSYFMRTGDLAGGISLGVFSRKDSAVGVQESLKKRGYATDLKEIQRMDTRFQIVLKLQDRERTREPKVQELLGKYRGIQVKEIACK
jgi:cell division septation protein DedD